MLRDRPATCVLPTSGLIPLWSVTILCTISVFKNVLRFVKCYGNMIYLGECLPVLEKDSVFVGVRHTRFR